MAAAVKNPVETKHPDYSRMLSKWQRCRDVSEGQDAVHAGGEAYLPKLKDQEPQEYAAYVKRAQFYNATWRTISGLVGMMFRKPPSIDVPQSLTEQLDDVTMTGVPLQAFANTIAEEAMTIGRVGIMVDYPAAPAGISQADAARLNLRPIMSMYRAESIINWRVRWIANRATLALVVLCEQHAEAVDEFEDKVEKRYRVLDLVAAADATGASAYRYRQRIFRVNEKGKQEQVGGDVYPVLGGRSLDYIPFVVVGTDDITPEIDEPPLIDLVDLNLSHYRTSADLEHGAHFTGLPTPVVSGYSPPNPTDKLYIGSMSAWVFTDPQAKASFLEFSGEGLGALETRLEKKELQMAVIGARMLEAQKKGVEAAETAAIHRVGEESTLASIAQTISMGMTKALQWFALWAGSADKVAFELNRDFFPVPMSPAQLTAIVSAWIRGAISSETKFNMLKAGEVYGPDDSFEDEEAKIAASAPPPPAPPQGAPQPQPQAA